MPIIYPPKTLRSWLVLRCGMANTKKAVAPNDARITSYNVCYTKLLRTAPTGGTYKVGETVTVGSAVTKTGYTFAGWNDGTTTYNP